MSIENLPPEMQERIAQIMSQAQQPQPTAAPQPAAVTKPPSLMDHTIALRQEVAALIRRLVVHMRIARPLTHPRQA